MFLPVFLLVSQVVHLADSDEPVADSSSPPRHPFGPSPLTK